MKIEFISSKKIKFKDGPGYEFLDNDPPPPSWTADHDYDVVERGEGKGIKRNIVVNKSLKDQERIVSGDGAIHKGYKIEKAEAPSDEILNKDLKIEALLGDSCIVVERYGSTDETVWQLDDITGSEREQAVHVSRGISRFKTKFNIKNLKLDKNFAYIL